MMDFGAEENTANENEENFLLLISELRKKVKSSKFAGSVVPRTDSRFLAKFIRTKDYDLDAAFKCIGKYYISVQKNQDITTDLTPSLCETAFRSRILQILKPCFNESITAVVRLKNWSPKDVDLRGVQLVSLFAAEQYTNTSLQIQLQGVVIVIDLEGCRFEHVRQLSVKELRRILHTGQDGVPLRIAGIHLLHLSSLLWPIFKITMKIMKEKIRRRVHLHSSYESLHQHLNKENLPQSLGGDLNEEEAFDTSVMDDLLANNTPYEKFWNGALEPNTAFPFEHKVESDLMERHI